MKTPLRLILSVGVFAASLATAPAAANAAQRRPDLTGVVKGSGGRPVADASVFIYTAGPRAGTGYL